VKAIPAEALSNVLTTFTVKDTSAPILGVMINGKRAWRVRLDSVYMDLPNWSSEWLKKYNPRDFTVVIDSATGAILWAYSGNEQPGAVPSDIPPQEISSALMGKQNSFHGFPTRPPKTKLQEALSVSSASSPLRASKIVAVYILYTGTGEPLHPVWAILGTEIPAKHSGLDREGTLNWRSIIDDNTGMPLRFETAPK